MTTTTTEKPEDHRSLYFLGMGLVSTGLLLFLLGGLWTSSTMTFKRKSVITKATVLKKDKSGVTSGSGDDEMCAPVIRFRFQGRIHTHTFAYTANYLCYPVGSTFSVRVHRRGKTLDVRKDGFLLLGPFLMMFVACCMLGLGVFFVKTVRNTREAQAQGLA